MKKKKVTTPPDAANASAPADEVSVGAVAPGGPAAETTAASADPPAREAPAQVATESASDAAKPATGETTPPEGQPCSAAADENAADGVSVFAAQPAPEADTLSVPEADTGEAGTAPADQATCEAVAETANDAVGPTVHEAASAPSVDSAADHDVCDHAPGFGVPAFDAAMPADPAADAVAEVDCTMAETRTVPEAETGFVPANLLVLSEKNARKTNKERKIEGLAASILRLGLLQNLVVSRRADGTFPVEAGERRRLAIGLLVQGKRVAEDWPVPVRFVDEADRTAASTMENDQREGMHPADQYQAFQELTDEGWTIDEIADAFSVTPLIVERRLALASAAPALLELLRRDEITTEQLMALCTTDDHELQMSVWTNTAEWNRHPGNLRRALVSAEIDLTRDPRVAFIGGVAAFVAAGGEVRRDLFSTDGQGGFTSDGVLLERLVAERLEAVAAELRAEGWGWVEIWPQWNHAEFYRLGRIQKTVHPLQPDAVAKVEALEVERAELSDEVDAFGDGYGDYDELPEADRDRYEAASARIDEITGELSAIERSRVSFDAEAVPAAGAIVGIEHGALQIERGLVRTADRPKVEAAVGGTQRITGGRETEVPGRKAGQLSDPVTRSLYGHRNLAAQSATAANSHVAKVLLACWLVQTLRHRESSVPIDLRISDNYRGTRTGHPIVDEGGAARRQAFDAIGQAMVAALPKADDALWDALMILEPAELDRLIAFAVASAVSLDRTHAGLTAKLLTALGFNIADHFTPTAENFFSRIPKALIIEAIGEAGRLGSDAQRSTLQALKKADLAARAETEVRDTRWVPALIRSPKAKAPRTVRKKRARQRPAADAPTGAVDAPPVEAGPVPEPAAEIAPTAALTAPPAPEAPPGAAAAAPEPARPRTRKRKEAPRATAKRAARKPDELATARKKKEGAAASPKRPARRRGVSPGADDAPHAPDAAAPEPIEELAA